ncbi:MAG TPA: MotA/TolQ/ExbB proton channel family protein [Thermoanaerobaculia bacterium]|nr:MotA/TolQ/ExbB proton channel family protein [Thermoanaerobaculia bacterium]
MNGLLAPVQVGPVEMSFTGAAVCAILLLLSVWSTMVSADRLIVFARARRQSRAFARALAQDPGRPDWIRGALDAAARYPHSHLARVVAAGLAAFQKRSARGLPHAEVIEAVNRAVDRSALRVTAEMRRGVSSLATIATTAPFIGLFGTVIGIIHAFDSIAREGAGGFATVSAGISEALVATALGLVVAIPAAWMFNVLTHRLERLGAEMASSSSELMDFFLDLATGEVDASATLGA